MYVRRLIRWAAALMTLVAGVAHLPAQEIGPARGTLLIAGGGDTSGAIFERFIELAGGPAAMIVVIPTVGGAESYDESHGMVRRFKEAGAAGVRVLYTRDRRTADSDAFVRPLRDATAVWITGGSSGLLGDIYVGTEVQRELVGVLERGGVVAGSSAGGNIQGTYLARGDARLNTLEDVVGKMRDGFALLRKEVVMDQHLLRRNRHFDLVRIIEAEPELLGIGIDEATAIVVQGDDFEVIGSSYVAIHDHNSTVEGGGEFYFLAPGDHFNLRTRVATREVRTRQRLDRIRDR